MTRSSIRAMWLSAAVVLACLFPGGAQETEPTPSQLLQAYEAFQRCYDRVSYRVETRTQYDGAALPTGTIITESVSRVWLDGDRQRYIASGLNRYPRRGKIGIGRFETEWVYPEKGMIIVVSDPERKRVNAVVARLDDVPSNERNVIASQSFAVVHGRLARNDETLLQILKESTLSKRRDQLQGKPMWVLEGTGSWGRYVLWLDPALGLVPRRIEQHKGEEDWFVRNKPLGSLRAGGLFFPKGTTYTQSYARAEVGAFELVGSQPVVKTLVLTEEDRFSNGNIVRTKCDLKFSEIKLGPEVAAADAFRVGTPIPNGTPVQVDDYPAIRYEWQNGQIVKSINQDALVNLESNWFSAGSWPGWRLLVVSTILAILALITLVAGYRYFRRHES